MYFGRSIFAIERLRYNGSGESDVQLKSMSTDYLQRGGQGLTCSEGEGIKGYKKRRTAPKMK